MLATPLFLALAIGFAAELPDAERQALEAIRTAYLRNCQTFLEHGTIRFRHFAGTLEHLERIDDLDARLKSDWTQRPPSHGVYLYDGPFRRYDEIHAFEDAAANPERGRPRGFSGRLLTDARSTFVDRMVFDFAARTVRHDTRLHVGASVFFRNAQGIPLRLGDPDVQELDLGNCLMHLLAASPRFELIAREENAVLDGTPVVMIRVKEPSTVEDREFTIWVDRARGAIPVRIRLLATLRHDGRSLVFQTENQDPRRVGDGWFPFRRVTAHGGFDPAGKLPNMEVDEYVIDEASFDGRPDHARFALDFPSEQTVTADQGRTPLAGRRVWSVDDFSSRTQSDPPRASLLERLLAIEPEDWLSYLPLAVGSFILVVAGYRVVTRSRRIL